MKLTPIARGRDHALTDAQDLAPEVYRRLVAHRARRLLSASERQPAVGPIAEEPQRVEVERELARTLEKVDGVRNFLPVRFLADGAARAAAVCRVVTGDGYGTGFLVAPGLLMTNHHVLPSAEAAVRSVAEFRYEDGQRAVRVGLHPDRLFLTSPEQQLDYTIVACETRGLDGIAPIPLLRNPATVSRHEPVNIVQHPAGRTKEIAVHDNQVLRVLDRVVRYQTDTQPGSSGSPVFNNDWELVALHHAGWEEAPGRATNEGIRISAIVADLLARARRDPHEARELRPALDLAGDSSPYLGFFDVAGVAGDGREVEVPDFSGDRAFADVGFWNIEHFNDGVPDGRVETVADVVARLAMDVIGLTEVEQGALGRLVAALGRRGFAMGYEVQDGGGRQDIAVLFDRETTQVRKFDAQSRYAAQLGAKTVSGDRAFPRPPLFAECTIGEGGERVRFMLIVVHLKAFGDLQSQARRRLAAEKLAEIIEDLRATQQLPVVLGGDFNERLHTDVLAALKAAPDLFALTADDATRDAISYVGDSHRSLIDHVVVSRDVALGTIAGDDAAIVRLDRSVRDFAGRVSDHVPVVFRMVYRQTPALAPTRPALAPPPGTRLPIPTDASAVVLHFDR